MMDPMIYFLFQPECNKDCDMRNPVCEIVHIKEPLVLIGKSSPCSGRSGFPLLPSEWSFITCQLFLIPASAPRLV